MKNIIEFINTSPFEQEHVPEPAIKLIPEWFRNAPIEISNKEEHLKHMHETKSLDEDKNIVATGNVNSMHTLFTIKKCMPVFDAMTAGYIIKLPADVTVFPKIISPGKPETNTVFSWGKVAPISAHGLEQVEGYPHDNIHTNALPKFINPWIIRTPPGYSCLFITPMHRDIPFTILPGIVDTDTFEHSVNFPFSMKDKDFDGIIEGGTPIAQVIPFKRDEFSLELYDAYDYVEKYPATPLFLKEFPDSYRKTHWHKKDYN